MKWFILLSLLSAQVSAHSITWGNDQSFTLSFYSGADDKSAKNESQDMAKSLCRTLATAKERRLVETQELDYLEKKHKHKKYIELKAKCIIKS